MSRSAFFYLFGQLFRFGVVGSLAALVNMFVVWLLVEKVFFLPPLGANVFAFLIAFWVSYFGHSRLTFNHAKHDVGYAVPRFFLVAVLSFLLNEGFYFLLLHFTSLPYLWALFLVLAIVPVFTFILSRFWAFRGAQ